MGLDRTRTEEERRGDLLVGLALRQQAQHLHLALCQAGGIRLSHTASRSRIDERRARRRGRGPAPRPAECRRDGRRPGGLLPQRWLLAPREARRWQAGSMPARRASRRQRPDSRASVRCRSASRRSPATVSISPRRRWAARRDERLIWCAGALDRLGCSRTSAESITCRKMVARPGDELRRPVPAHYRSRRASSSCAVSQA